MARTRSAGKRRKAPARRGGKASASARRRFRLRLPSFHWPGFGAIGRWVAYWTVVIGIWAGVAVSVLVAFYAYDLPDISRLEGQTRAPGVTITAANGQVLATYGEVYADYVTYEDLPPHLVDAVVSIEDRRFFDHFGIDIWGIVRAAVTNLRAGHLVQGGSTLTQQVAKNVFLTHARTLRRKVQEVLLALWLEHRFTKNQLLTIYLNRVYLGAGTYGVEAASMRYFGKSVRRIGVAEAAMLAGLPKAPSRYAPTRNLDAARDRAAIVLSAMVDAGRLDAGTAAAAKASPATLVGSYVGSGSARYFADWIADQITVHVGRPTRDLVVQTTLNPNAQTAAERAVAAVLADAGTPKHIGQAALVAMSPDGAVRAMVGGSSYAKSQYNRAVQARRQPGSAFKLAVYAAALESGFEPGDTVRDEPITIDGWQPRNYGGTYRGEITLTNAIAHSSNSVAVQLTEAVGRDTVIETARRLGINTPLSAKPSLALGAAEVTLLELTGAYAVVPNGGRGVIPYGIEEIRSRDGEVLFRRGGSGLGRALSRQTTHKLDVMLDYVVREGTGKRAALSVPAAGKTGTSQDFRDAWFIGYRSGLVAGVWLGNDDASPMNEVTGGGLPAHLWRDFMSRYPP